MLQIIKHNALSVACFAAWLAYMCATYKWTEVFTNGWPMSITMAFGSFVAGSTPLGSGAVSFPVLTLVFNIVANNARTFAIMIQSVGMSCASYRILMVHHDQISALALMYMIWTGIMGFNIGYYLIRLPSDYVKTIYFSLTLALGVLVQSYINKFITKVRESALVITPRHLLTFVPVSMLGGVLLSMVGTGWDVVMYIYVRFLHNTEEVVITNHTIIAQSFLVLFAFYNALVMNPKDITPLVCTYWLACVPVVLVFAPLGNYAVNNWVRNREKLNVYIYALEILQYVAGFVITMSRAWETIALSTAIVGSTLLALTGFHLAKKYLNAAPVINASQDDREIQIAQQAGRRRVC